MKKVIPFHFISIILVGLFLFSCSRKKDKFINRNWHAMTTYYNTLYNGGVSFDEGKSALIEAYQDNYWKQLPIERLEVREDYELNERKTPEFLKAEEKAAKAIQKHSMEIKGKELNHQTDEAFMLLGKARYFDQRFIQALEAFNYILYKYPTSNNINNARIWKAKIHLRLENNEAAAKSLKKMLFEEKIAIKKQELADAASILAQAYVNLKHKDSAIAPMKIAIANTKSNEEKGRYHYILGQLYNRVKERDSANLEFDKIIKLNRRTPREYLVNAYLAKARNLEIQSEDQIAFLDILNELEDNWENRPFLDRIYYEKAIFFFGTDSLDLATNYYNKSLRTDSGDNYLRSLNYETLGRISFSKAEYKKAGAYMDSTLGLLDENSKRYRVIKKKRDNLDDVLLYETITTTNDSILRLAGMSKSAQLNYFQKYTDSLKVIKAENIKKQKAKSAKRLQNSGNFSSKAFSQSIKEQQQFYFYNSNTLANGKLQFEQIFGKRKLVDNWKVSSLSQFSDVAEAIEEIDEDYDIDKDPTFDPKLYVKKIPTDKAVLDSLAIQRNEAYFQLGTIYKEQLREYDKASDKFETLLTNSPEKRHILPVKYNLYKIYQANGNAIREEKIRQDILTNHPNSRYATIVKDPFKEVVIDENDIERDYTKIYRQFENQEYIKVLSQLDTYIEKFKGDPFSARFELLKAQTLGRAFGVHKMESLLNHIALTYPQADEGKKAQKILDEHIPYLKALSFKSDTLGKKKKYKLIYDFYTTQNHSAKLLKSTLDTIIKKRNFNYLKTSIDYYAKDTLFVVIHGLNGKGEAGGMNKLLLDTIQEQHLNRRGLSVSSENYSVIQAQKKYKEYKQQLNTIY